MTSANEAYVAVRLRQALQSSYLQFITRQGVFANGTMVIGPFSISHTGDKDGKNHHCSGMVGFPHADWGIPEHMHCGKIGCRKRN